MFRMIFGGTAKKGNKRLFRMIDGGTAKKGNKRLFRMIVGGTAKKGDEKDAKKGNKKEAGILHSRGFGKRRAEWRLSLRDYRNK